MPGEHNHDSPGIVQYILPFNGTSTGTDVASWP